MKKKRSRLKHHTLFSDLVASACIPKVVIIGRPNVGKSTLFNRIVGTRSAIVDNIPGVTRDRIFAQCRYQERQFQLVDTGGFEPSTSEGMVGLIRLQSQTAIAEADILLVIMDGRAGITALDQEIAAIIREVKTPTFFAINKIDTPTTESLLAEFYQLGAETLFPISAEQGLGIDELLEAILPLLPITQDEEPKEPSTRIAMVGRPNVGKSTLINTMLGEERVLVSDIPGTTRDPVDTVFEYQGNSYTLTDTAGLRRRGRVEQGVEGYSVGRTIKALGRSDIAILLLDGLEGITEQDTKIAGLIQKQGRGCILFINKWDLKEREHDAQAHYIHDLKRRFPFFAFVPIIFGSAFHPGVIEQLFPIIQKVMKAFSQRVPTSQLNQFLQQALVENPIPIRKRSPVKSVFMTQVSTQPPTFALFIGKSVEVSANYRRYLENRLRDTYGFEGTPLFLLIRQK